MERNQEEIIFECLGRLLIQADKNQQLVDQLIDKLYSNIKEYSSEHYRFKQEIKNSISQTLDSAIAIQLEKIAGKFELAKKNAEFAAIAYSTESKKASWRMTWTGILLILSSAIITYGFLAFYVPSPGDMRDLIQKQNDLQKNIDELEKLGALVDFTYCGSKKRLCAKVDFPSYKNTYFYGEGKERYIILNGY